MNEWYSDTPLLLILLALDGISHHISGIAMHKYVKDPKVKAWYEDEGKKLVKIFSDYGYKCGEVTIVVYPPLYPEDVGFQVISGRSGSKVDRIIYYKGGELSQYTLLV